VNVLQTTDEMNGKLRMKAMECAGLIGKHSFHIGSMDCSSLTNYSAIAVGKEVFRADANSFVEALLHIQSKSSLNNPRVTSAVF
jgi:hypothetical protein